MLCAREVVRRARRAAKIGRRIVGDRGDGEECEKVIGYARGVSIWGEIVCMGGRQEWERETF